MTGPRAPKPLSEKQEKYVNAVMEGASKNQASVLVGNAHHTSMERQKEVKQALVEAKTELQNITTIRRVDVIDGIMEAITMARTMAEPATMISGWKEIAKLCGLAEPETRRVILSTDALLLQDQLAVMSTAELLELASKGRVFENE